VTFSDIRDFNRSSLISNLRIFASTYTDALISQVAPAVPASAPTLARSGSTGTSSTTGTVPPGVPEWQASPFLSYDFGRRGAGYGPLVGLRHVRMDEIYPCDVKIHRTMER